MSGRFLDLASPVNRAHPLNLGLGTWLLAVPGASGVGGARVLDLAGANHGTMANGTTWSSPLGRPGGWGAWAFDATDDRLTLPGSVLLASSPFTIAWWERVSASANTYPSRFRLSVSGGSAEFLVIRSSDANYDTLAWAEVGSTPAVTASSAPSLASSVGVWHHWCLVCRTDVTSNTAADYDLYVNGTSLAVDNGSGFGLSGNTLNYIGYDGADSGAECAMDDVRVYPARALTASAAAALYSESRQGYPAALTWRRRGGANAVAAAGVTRRYLSLLGCGR